MVQTPFRLKGSEGMPRTNPVVELEEHLTDVLPSNNGSGPLWCYGSPTIVRNGEELFVSIPETNPLLTRLCKTRGQLWRRQTTGWEKVRLGDHFDEREPCPLVRLPGGRLMLSVNPLADRSLTKGGGQCVPGVLEVSVNEPFLPPKCHSPIWDKPYESFSEHSYRGIGVDYDQETVLLVNIDAHQGYAWSLLDRTGVWSHNGFFEFPIRACYPQLGLRNGAAHVLAVGDIVETNEAWRAHKQAVTGAAWDYDFRRLFYTWTPDICCAPFREPLEIATYEATAGHIRNSDMWIDSEGAVHLLFTTKNIWHDFMRDRFFPGTPIISTIEYRVFKDGKLICSHTLTSYVKDERDATQSGILYPGAAFHATPTGELRVVYTWGNNGLYLMQVHPWIGDSPAHIPLKRPIHHFCIPAPRNGSETTSVIDLYGMSAGSNGLYYARVTA